MIIHLQAIANRLSDAFNDTTKVTKSHILTVNTLAQIHVPEKHEEMNNNVLCLKLGRPIGSKDVGSHKNRRGIRNLLF